MKICRAVLIGLMALFPTIALSESLTIDSILQELKKSGTHLSEETLKKIESDIKKACTKNDGNKIFSDSNSTPAIIGARYEIPNIGDAVALQVALVKSNKPCQEVFKDAKQQIRLEIKKHKGAA
ncbi:MAG: hypothetical protein SGJ18_07005 [Pseudomonadota bacterium]|nr:hypothetical protein [Pseudomonadota bacterium]